MTKEEITKIVMNGNTGEYSHCIIYCDHWDYTYGHKYVEYGDNIDQVKNDITKFGSPGMYTIEEIYSYNLDLSSQLNERRAYHPESYEKSKESKITEEEHIKPSTTKISITNNRSKRLKEAISFASEKHKGQTRKNGEPYIYHPLRVMQYVLEYKRSKHIEDLLIAACLHDVIEDTDTTYYDVFQKFGPLVASLVKELTTDEDMKNALGKSQYLAIKMANMTSWGLDIKLCDRLDNVESLINCGDEKFKNKYTKETIDIIDHLSKKAKLTGTSIKIIKQIIISLIKQNADDKEKIITLSTIHSNLSEIKRGLQDENDINRCPAEASNNENDIYKQLILKYLYQQ